MGHAVLLGALVARARVEGDEHGQRARARQRDPVDRQPVARDGGRLDARPSPAHDIQRAAGARSSGASTRGDCKTRCMQAFCSATAARPRYPPGPMPATDTLTAPQRRIAARASLAARARRAERQRRGAHAKPRRSAPPRARRPRHGRRVPRRLEALRARRRRPRARDVRGPPPGDGLPRRADRLGQVDDHAPADQGARADRRAHPRRRARPRRDRAQEGARTTGATSASSSRTSSCCRRARSTTTSPTRCR